MSAPYDHSALWLKAKLFINRAMDDDQSFDESAMWASLSLEVLAKAALAKASPLLIAAPNEEGKNILIALGLVKGEGDFLSVSASTVWKRCARAFRPFSEAEATKIAKLRNEYLHGADIAFGIIPERAWWPRYWAQADILLTALDVSIEDFVGEDRSALVDQHLSQNVQNNENRVQALLARAEQRVGIRTSTHVSARVADEFASAPSRQFVRDHTAEQDCPACHASATLEGDEEVEREVEWQQIYEGEYEPVVTVTIAAEYFACDNCGLVFETYELLQAAGLPDSFTVAGELDAGDYEPDYGND